MKAFDTVSSESAGSITTMLLNLASIKDFHSPYHKDHNELHA